MRLLQGLVAYAYSQYLEILKSPDSEIFYLLYNRDTFSTNLGVNFILNILTFIILFQNLIPIRYSLKCSCLGSHPFLFFIF